MSTEGVRILWRTQQWLPPHLSHRMTMIRHGIAECVTATVGSKRLPAAEVTTGGSGAKGRTTRRRSFSSTIPTRKKQPSQKPQPGSRVLPSAPAFSNGEATSFRQNPNQSLDDVIGHESRNATARKKVGNHSTR